MQIKHKDSLKYVPKFKRNNHVSQLKISENVIKQPQCIVEASAAHFSLIFNSPSSVAITNNVRFTVPGFVNVPSFYESDVKQAIQRFSPSKCIGPDEIPSFIPEGCSEICVPLLSNVFNISSLQGKFPTLWKQAPVVPVFRKGNSALITNYGPITTLNHFFPLFFVYNI
jgi:hypothetical protein